MNANLFFFPSFLSFIHPFMQSFIEHILCVRQCAKLWRSTGSKTAQVSALMGHSSCFRGEMVNRDGSPVFLLGERGKENTAEGPSEQTVHFESPFTCPSKT